MTIITKHFLLSSLVALSAAVVGCDETVDLVAAPVVVSGQTLALHDADGAQVETELVVERVFASATTDLQLDWSALRHDLWGRELDPTLDAQRVMLYHFRTDDLDLLLDGIEQGTLSQSVVDMQVTCESEDARCALSEFTFMVGHYIDVVGRFVDGDGTWLVVVQSNDGAENLAYLSLVPSTDVNLADVDITDDSSARLVESDLLDMPALSIAADAPVVVDWSALTLDSMGQQLRPGELDMLTLARVPTAALDDAEAVLLALPEVADELWVGTTPGTTSLALSELVNLDNGEQGFVGLSGPGSWVLTLGCSACDDAMPRYVARLDR
jgi:hypothetical protein